MELKSVDSDIHRIVELQARTVSRRTTDTPEEYDYIEELVDSTKPPMPSSGRHYLIETPFRYPLPVAPQYSARFRPPFHPKNAFYGCFDFVTSVYETGFHFLKERIHVKDLSQTVEKRTHFTVGFSDAKTAFVHDEKKLKDIMDRKTYEASHEFVKQHANVDSIAYPSCRVPERGDCLVTFNINTLGKQPNTERTVHFVFDSGRKSCHVTTPVSANESFDIIWEQVS